MAGNAEPQPMGMPEEIVSRWEEAGEIHSITLPPGVRPLSRSDVSLEGIARSMRQPWPPQLIERLTEGLKEPPEFPSA